MNFEKIKNNTECDICRGHGCQNCVPNFDLEMAKFKQDKQDSKQEEKNDVNFDCEICQDSGCSECKIEKGEIGSR